MIYLKLLAHFITCTALSEFLEHDFGLTGAKFWIIYLALGTFIWLVNAVIDK